MHNIYELSASVQQKKLILRAYKNGILFRKRLDTLVWLPRKYRKPFCKDTKSELTDLSVSKLLRFQAVNRRTRRAELGWWEFNIIMVCGLVACKAWEQGESRRIVNSSWCRHTDTTRHTCNTVRTWLPLPRGVPRPNNTMDDWLSWIIKNLW